MKAQVSMEFVFLIAVAFMILLVFTAVTRDKLMDLSSESEYVLLKDVTYMVQSELYISSMAENDYNRVFNMPMLLGSSEYSIKVDSRQVTANTSKYEFVLPVPSVVGNLQKGNNTINKSSGVIYLN